MQPVVKMNEIDQSYLFIGITVDRDRPIAKYNIDKENEVINNYLLLGY